MTQEEKARAYDEAKARISKAFNDNRCTIGFMNEIFPELKGSEDERIRKALIKYYSFNKDGGSHALDNITPKQIVDWLEKQGEQKPVEWSEADEQYLLVCKNALNRYQMREKRDAEIISKWLEEKLKSIRPQKQWKPSEEQINAIGMAITFVTDDFSDNPTLSEILKDLQNQLKAL